MVLAQSDLGTIAGFVKDSTGATVPNATVKVRNASGIDRQVMTNETGRYTVTNLPPGLYTISVQAQGFKAYTSADNKLDPSANLVVDVDLTVGATSETVEVIGAAEQLQTESATVQRLVTRQQIDALELNGRNPIFMANLVPGTRGANMANLSFSFSQGPNNINGARTPESLITYDGAPAVRTRSNGTSLGSADVDSTQEIQILTADYAAEYGRSSGGQIRIITKSGTQTFHGAAYEYVRNTMFNANTWPRNNAVSSSPLTNTQFVTAPVHYNQFGYNIGGPFWIPNHFNTNKNKVFWYWGEEWVRYVFTDTQSLTVPSLKMRRGDFSELLDPNNFYYSKKVVQVKDPKTGLPYPGNIIPAPGTGGTLTNASANGLGILNAWPVPNLDTPIDSNKNWFFSASHPQRQRKDTLAVDINFTENQRLRLRRNYYTFWEYQPLDGNTNETPKYFDRPNQTNSLDYTWVINPRMVNELLITGSKDKVKIPIDAAHFLDRTKGAIQGAGYFGTNYQYIFNDGKLLSTRIPSVNLTNFSTLNGGPYPSHSAGPIVDFSDSLTWVKGNHTFKFGALYEYQGENDNDEINVQACSTCTNNQNGQFQFTDGRSGGTGVAAANVALGLFDRYSEIGHRAYTVFRAGMWEGFAQDAWKVNQRLTVTAGLRYTVIVPYHAIWGNMIVFDPTFYDPSKAVTVDPRTGLITGNPTIEQRYNGMVIPGSSFPSSAKDHVPEANTSLYNGLFRGVPDHYSDIQWNDIQPRLGIAYQLTPKTVVRAGGGRFYTRLGVSDSVFLGGNPPFQPSASLTNGTVDSLGPSAAAAIPFVVTTQTKNFRNPEAWNWNATVERELPWKLAATVGYVGRRGLRLQREANINQPTIATVVANPGVNIDALRPYKGYGSIRQTDNIASSRYNSLQTTLNRRFSSGFQFGFSYTLSKSEDNGSNQRDVVPDTYDTSFLWGPSEFDTRHIFVANYLYNLPFFKTQQGFAGKVLGGWQVSGIVQMQTGQPCSVGAATDYAGVGLDSNFGCGVNGQYWVMVQKPKMLHQFGSSGQWFQTCIIEASPCPDGSAAFNGNDQRIFRPPTAKTFSTQHVRNLFYQPGIDNWNMGLFKSVKAGERVNFQFRAEAFNIWNHPNWGGSNGGGVQFNANSYGTLGKVTTKGSERNLQLSLRMEF